MKKEDSAPKNIIFKKLETNEIKKKDKFNYKKSNDILTNDLNDSFDHNNKKYNKDIKLNSFNDKHLHKKSCIEKKKSNLVSLSKTSNQDISNKLQEKVKFITDSENLKLNSYINSSNAKYKNKNKNKKRNRYLTYFENSDGSIDNDEPKINNLLNDFIKPSTIKNINEVNNKENVNLYSNLNKQRNDNSIHKKNLIIKVNKKKYANNRPKNFYIQACLKLKEKQKNKSKNRNESEFEDSRKGNLLKLPKRINDRKRNVINYVKLKQNKQNCNSIDKEINKSVRTSKKGNSLAKNQKSSNSFRICDKKLFINSNYLRKQRTKPSSDFHTFRENKKWNNRSCIEKEDKLNEKEKIKTSNIVINNYEQKKKSVQKEISPIPLKRSVINHNSFLSLDNNNLYSKHRFQNNLRTQSEKNDDIFNNKSFNKKNSNIKNLINNFNDNIYFSLDFSLNKKNENSKNKILNQKYLLSPKSLESRDKKISSSVYKDRHKRQLSKINTASSNFDIDELNKKLFKVIKKIEKQEEKIKEIKKSDKNDDGFIKWDIFEKVIAEEN